MVNEENYQGRERTRYSGRVLEGRTLEGQRLEGRTLEGQRLEGRTLEGRRLVGRTLIGRRLVASDSLPLLDVEVIDFGVQPAVDYLKREYLEGAS